MKFSESVTGIKIETEAENNESGKPVRIHAKKGSGWQMRTTNCYEKRYQIKSSFI